MKRVALCGVNGTEVSLYERSFGARCTSGNPFFDTELGGDVPTNLPDTSSLASAAGESQCFCRDRQVRRGVRDSMLIKAHA